MAGELQPDEGVVQARSCSWMTQRTELFQDSLRNNLRLADADDDEQLWGVLQAAGLRSDVMALPQGLDTMLGEGGRVCPEASRAGWHWPDCC
jgi:ATP-binding cassette subfamily C protein CydC